MKVFRRISFCALVLSALPFQTSAAAPAPTPGAPVEIADGRFNHRITQATGPISVDGRLDETAWDDALTLELGYETRPNDNVAAPVRTTVKVTYDERRIYVAFRAFDPDPAQIRARLADRDTPWEDDLVGFGLDTFNDERRAFEFYINPLGVQIDVRTDNTVNVEDSSWDAIWSSAGRITEEGYEVEASVPFSSLRFQRIEGDQTWGFDALRFYPRSFRHRLNLQPISRDVSCYVCQASKITGMAGVTPGRNLELTPTATANRIDRRDAPGGRLETGDVDSDFGLTASWGITPNLNLSGTLNPDFSQVEADEAQLDINTQFALFFPERRPFFLEGADTFNTPIQAVFTRTVADPAWGAKLIGKEGVHGVGIFVAQDEVTNLLFPGSQGSRSTSLDLESTDAVARYRRDIGDASSVGVLFTNREADGYSNTVAGVDGVYRVNDSNVLRFQGLRSETRYPDQVAADFDQPEGSFDGNAFTVRYNHDSRNWGIYGQYREADPGFRADMGFVNQTGTSFLLGGVQRTWRGDDKYPWNHIEVGADWDLTEDDEGRELERELEAWAEISGPLQSFAMLRGGTRTRFFNGVIFDEDFAQFYGELSPTGSVEISLFARQGDTIDFANTQPAEETRIDPELELRLGKHLLLEVEQNRLTLDVDEGQLFEANLTNMRLVYQFNLRSFLRTIVQYTDITRDPALFDFPVDAETEVLFSQLLFSYKVNPRTVLFLGYSENRVSDDLEDLEVEDRALFLKLGYAWVL